MPRLGEIYMESLGLYHNVSDTMSSKYALHCHNYYEIYYFISGNVDILVEGQCFHLEPYSLLLFAPHSFHGAKVNDTSLYERYSINFHADLLSPDRRNYLLSIFSDWQQPPHQTIYFAGGDQYHLDYYFKTMEACQNQPEEVVISKIPIYMEALLYQIMVMQQTLGTQEYVNSRCELIDRILLFLNEHLTEPINLDLISQKFFVSKHHLNKIFRKALGTTVADYLLRKRIIYAQQLLINGSSAIEAATMTGFRDYSTFYRAYIKVLGHSPIKDRKVMPSFKTLDKHQYLYTINR